MSSKSRTRRRATPEAFHWLPRDAARLRRAMALPQPCLLCGAGETVCAALFVPARPEVWGGAPDTRRVLVYRLCARCFAKPDKAQAVEAMLMARLVGHRN